MTYCLAIEVDAGLVFASDSRTNAGVDQVSTYSKLHSFGYPGKRQIVLLSAGNLATTQGVIARLDRDIRDEAPVSLMTVTGMADAADYIGTIIRAEGEKHGSAVAAAGFNAEATFIVGGQVAGRPMRLFLIYPQGNYITTSEDTPYLQIGEVKYGKPVLDRIVKRETTLEHAARIALVSMDSTMRSNATVGPPIEVLAYRRDSLLLDEYRKLAEDDEYLLALRHGWNEGIVRAFEGLPAFTWQSRKPKPA